MANLFVIDSSDQVIQQVMQLSQSAPDITFIGGGQPNDQTLTEVKQIRPDILLVDLPASEQQAQAFLQQLKSLHLPVIIFTQSEDFISQNLVTLLESGAVGFVPKPADGQLNEELKHNLLKEIRLNSPKAKTSSASTAAALLEPARAVAIGSSTGGPEALVQLLSQVPADFRYGIVIVQHMPAQFTARFAQRLDKICPLPVKEAQAGDKLTGGQVLLAPGGQHLEFYPVTENNRTRAKVRLTNDPPVWGLRPTVDHMMTTLAPIYQQHLIGIILTGMGEDGVIGMKAIKHHHGHTLVQDKETSAVFGMGQQVIKNHLADEVLPLNQIFPRVLQLLHLA